MNPSSNAECEFTLLPVNQCGGACCRPDLNEPEPDFAEELAKNVVRQHER